MAKTKAKTVKKAKPAREKAPPKKAAAKKPAGTKKPEAKKAPAKKAAPAPKKAAPAPKKAAPAPKKAAPAPKAPAKPAGKPKARAAKPTDVREAGAPAMPRPGADEASRDELNEATYHAMDAAWSRWGTLDPNLLTHLLNPSLAGGPRWPGMRQAYRVARQGANTMLASDGLATPYDPPGPPERQGLGLEVFAITSDPIDDIPGSWLWGLVYHAAQLAADHGGLAGLIDELGVVSSELYNVPIPPEHAARYVNEAGRVGVLLGIEDFAVLPPRVDGPLGTIRLVNVKLLTLSELAHVLQHGEAGRKELARRFGASPGALVSSLTRPDVA